MPLSHIVFLALVQGLTEFLPVSSAAHLILGGKLLGWPDQGLVFDLGTHIGTLLAVLVYFRSELLNMLRACIGPVRDDAGRQDRKMATWLVLASIPALLAGALMHDVVEHLLRDLRVIAVTTFVFGLVLWWADRAGSRALELRGMTLGRALLIGIAQAMALVPGVSRSGITITAGRFLGFTPDAAARFSFLLAIPITGAAGAYGALRVATGSAAVNWTEFGLAVLFAGIAGWVCIAAFLALLRRVGLLPFVLYRLALGLALFAVAF